MKPKSETLEQNFSDAVKARDFDTIMANYQPGQKLFVFDVTPPREYMGRIQEGLARFARSPFTLTTTALIVFLLDLGYSETILCAALFKEFIVSL
jgi:hypothetical protein